MLRKRGLYAYQAMAKMNLSRPTLNKYFENPETMNGIQRKKLASIFTIDVELIDNICNGKIKQTAEEYTRILEMIVPLKRKQDDTE